MKKFLISLLFAVICASLFAFTGCNNKEGGGGDGDNTGGTDLPSLSTVTVTFIIDGEVKETQTVNYGKNFSKPSVNVEKEGYTFEGWQRENGRFVNFNLLDETKVTEDITLTAAYSVNSYKIEFYYMEKLLGSAQKVEYGKNFTLPADDSVIPAAVGTVKGYKLRGGDGALIKKADMDLTVRRDASYDVIATLNPYESIELVNFKTEFGLNDKYVAGDDAEVKVTFADETEYVLKESEYEIIAPEDFGTEEKDYEIKVKIKLLDDMEKTLTATVKRNKEKISVLFIGNSYSDDTIDLSYNVAKSAGFKNIEIATLYYPGCTINQHIDFMNKNEAAYIFRYFKEDGKLNVPTDIGDGVPKSTMLYGIKYKDWDYIILQQGSRESGLPAAYGNVNVLINNVLANATDKNVKLAFNMTWAYRQGSSNRGFANYNNDQQKMYDGIVESVKTQIVPNGNFVKIIPNGTAVQNARTSLIGDNLTRDDADHLTLDFGRYVAALNFISVIGGVSVDDISYAPANLSKTYISIAKESVKNSIANPYAVTKSVYAPADASSIEGKTAANLTFTKGYYYSSNNNGTYTDVISTAGNSSQYFCTVKFNKETLPVGSVLYIASGYQYRPEGWINGARNTDATRPANVSSTYVIVTEEWWGSFTERAFNVSKIGTPDISGEAAKMPETFKIYLTA